jgi:hypothetical protein
VVQPQRSQAGRPALVAKARLRTGFVNPVPLGHGILGRDAAGRPVAAETGVAPLLGRGTAVSSRCRFAPRRALAIRPRLR